mgnify:CR=1 FL=1
MGTPVLILGDSGSGKSTSMMNLDASRTFLIQAINKRLPFPKPESKGWIRRSPANPSGNVMITDNYDQIIKTIHGAARSGKFDRIIVDDTQYLMSNDFMRRALEVGFTKFTSMAVSFNNLFHAAMDCAGDTRVYFLAHTDLDMNGKTKMKTIGKLLDEKITLEGLFSFVIGCSEKDGDHIFRVKGSSYDTYKTPIGMFESDEIPNDLQLVENALIEYYELT